MWLAGIRSWITAGGVAVLVVGGVALAGGFADAADRLPVLPAGETFRSDRADLTVRRAWVSKFRPDESRAYTKPDRRLFVELDVTSRGFESESLVDGNGFGPGAAPVALLGGEPRRFTSVYDAGSWQSRHTIHPGVPERVVLTLPWPAGVPVRSQVRLRFDNWTVDESNLLLDKVWTDEPGAYADVPLGPEPPPVRR